MTRYWTTMVIIFGVNFTLVIKTAERSQWRESIKVKGLKGFSECSLIALRHSTSKNPC